MDREQKEAADKALKRLDELKAKIGGGDASEELIKEYNDILVDAQTDLYELLRDIQDNGIEDYWNRNNTVSLKEYPSCGVVSMQEDYTSADVAMGSGEIENILSEIRDNPLDYSQLQDVVKDASPGRGAGTERFRIMPLNIGPPKWVDEIETELMLFKKRTKTKSWYDPISFVEGIPSKQREKKVLKTKTLFILLDVSYSMQSKTKKGGETVLTILASYILPIVERFNGELWQIDDGAPQKMMKFSDLTKALVEGIPMTGLGGTAFNEAFRFLDKRKQEYKAEYGEETEFMTILFTDAQVKWNFKLPDNLLIVTLEETVSGETLPKMDPAKNQKIIVMD